MKYLAPIPKQFVDHSGVPLSNGTVHVYISGDTQYANVYQDADGNELMPNPARLDSNGAWVGFVTAGIPMDYVVEDKDGNVQFEYERVVAAQGGSGSQVAIEPVLTSGTKIAECWVDGELLELFAPDAALPIRIESGTITNNGTNLTCTGDNAWAEGKSNEATGDYSHAEGQLCKAKGQASHAGGQACETSGQNSFAHGAYLKTSGQSSCQAAFGIYNSDQKAMFVIGNGTAENNRKDAFKVDSSGDTWVTIGGVLTKVTNVSGGGGQTLTFVAGGSSGGGGGGDIPAEDYNILSGITNGTSNFCSISNAQISIDVLTSDLIEFNLFISSNWSSLNPNLYLIDDYSNGRSLGILLDYRYCYLTNRPIYDNYQGEILPQINKNTSLKISQKGGSIFVNEEEFVISSNTGEQMQHLTRFLVSPGNPPQQIVINSMIVKDKDGNYKYNFVPVLNKQTNQKGLFETVGQVFHYLSNYQV